MAVKANTTENLRKSKRWNERDDAALCLILKKKIQETTVGMRECNTPYERSRLKSQKDHFKEMLHKVESGSYNGDIIFGEMKAAAMLHSNETATFNYRSTTKGAKDYLNSYTDTDFDYESALRKKRYYGFSLPLILMILSVLIIAVFATTAFVPAKLREDMHKDTNLDALFIYRLSEDSDISITNDGNWPSGTYGKDADGYAIEPQVQGEPYADEYGNKPATVLLFKDIGMQTIDISTFDVVKAWFSTPMLKKVRLDFLEDNKLFQGTSYYYKCYMEGDKASSYKITKDENGNLDISSIFRYVGVYGTIYCVILAVIFAILGIIMNFFRIFRYTSRKPHFTSWIGFIFCFIALICPALADVDSMAILPAISNYFNAFLNSTAFLAEPTSTAGVSLLFLVPLALNLVLMILPKFFRNRFKKIPRFVPKGNENRLRTGDAYIVYEEDMQNTH